MTDLNDFFAKKDRKKKRAAARSAQAASQGSDGALKGDKKQAPGATSPPRKSAAEAAPAAAQTSAEPTDDGWIEIEDPRGSQVNTGGRTVVELKRDNEEKEKDGDSTTQTERFSGWGAKQADTETSTPADDAPAQPEAEKKYKPPGSGGMMSASLFPSLADAAKVSTVTPQHQQQQNRAPAPTGPPSTVPKSGPAWGPRARPRFTVDTEKLKRRLAEREANAAPPTQ